MYSPRRNAWAAGLLMMAAGAQAWGAIIFYTTSGAFQAAAPGLPTEDFEQANVAPGAFVTVTSPINAATSNSAFTAGAVLPGFSISSTGAGGPSLVVLGTGTTTGGTREVGIATFGNTLEIDFTFSTAVGMNLIAGTGPGAPVSATFNVSVFGTSGLLGSTTVAATGVNTYIGMTAPTATPISSVQITEQGGNASTIVDNLSFGTSGVQDRATFAANFPGAVKETFEAAHISAGGFTTIASPINAATGNAAFNVGDVVSGFSISAMGGGGTDLVVLGTGTTPGGTKEVGMAAFANTMEIDFTKPVDAVGFDLLASTGPGSLSSGAFLVSVFGAGGLLTSDSVPVSGLNTFFGFSSSSELITEVTITNPSTNASVLIDNLNFDVAPEPASLALCAVGALALLRRPRRI